MWETSCPWKTTTSGRKNALFDPSLKSSLKWARRWYLCGILCSWLLVQARASASTNAITPYLPDALFTPCSIAPRFHCSKPGFLMSSLLFPISLGLPPLRETLNRHSHGASSLKVLTLPPSMLFVISALILLLLPELTLHLPFWAIVSFTGRKREWCPNSGCFSPRAATAEESKSCQVQSWASENPLQLQVRGNKIPYQEYEVWNFGDSIRWLWFLWQYIVTSWFPQRLY